MRVLVVDDEPGVRGALERALRLERYFGSEAQGWLTKTFPSGGPTSWADFWDFTKFPGKRAIPGSEGRFWAGATACP